MKQILPRFGQYLTAVLLFLMMSSMGWGQVIVATQGVPSTENFNTLASSGTSTLMPTGWFFLETGTGANSTYTAGNGSSNSGDTYSFGLDSSDRSLGTVLSGSVTSTIGANFLNSTGSQITSISISYVGEQWRLGATGRQDRLDFQYSLNATSLNTGTWNDFNTLDFGAPITTGTVGLLDGNNSLNRVSINDEITGLNLPNGSSIWIRWTDFNASSADDGLAIDDFSITFNGTPSPTIATTGTLSAINTTFGNASSNTSFNVSGANMATGISINPPAGFEVSTNADFLANVGTNGTPIIVGAAGTIASTTIYVRISATTNAGTYSGNIVLTSSNATTVNVATASSTVSKATPTINTVPTASAITLGQPLSASTLSEDGSASEPGTFAFTNPSTIPPSIGIYEADITFTPTDSNNFNSVTTTTNVQVDAPTDPTIVISESSFNFNEICQNQVSILQTYVVSALSLTGDVTITAPTHFQIKTGAGAWGTEIVLSPVSGTIAETTIEVRFAPTATGAQSGDITHNSAGATTQNITVSGIAINTLPTVGTPTSTNIGTTSATLGGNITNEGCQDVTTRGVEFSTSNNFVTGTGTQVSETASFTTGAFTVEVGSLTAETTYYYRAFATSSAGTTYSDQASFTTLSTNANLSNLVLSAGTLTPAFDAATVTYTASVSGATTSITVTPTVQVTGATIQVRVNGGSYAAVNSGNASGALALNVGNNTVEVLVTAQDATTTKLYTITVSRPEPPVLIAGWDFQTTTANNYNSNIAAPIISRGNNNGTTTLLTTTSASSGYSGATGGNNAGAAARTGSLNTDTDGSAFFEFTIVPNSDYQISISDISFGSRGTSTAPQAFTLRSSSDNFASDIFTGSIPNNSTWVLRNNTSTLNQVINDNQSITYRIFGYNGTGTATAGTANWRLDDLKVEGLVNYTASIWQNNAWSNTSGPSSTISADIQEDLTLNSNLSVKNLYLTSGILNLNGYTLTVNGSIIKTNGTIQASNGKVIFTNPTNSTIPNNTFVNNTLEDLELNTTQQVALSGTLKVTGVFTPTQGTLNSNGNLIIGSDANGTARVAQVGAGASITGNVVVERYIPAKRAWRFLTAPVTGSTNNSVYFNWQNNGAAGNNGTGVNLWAPNGTGNAGNGLVAGGGAPNMYKYKTVAPAGWDAITDTQNEPLFTDLTNNAFMVFVTGGANSTNIASGATATTMAATGALRVGDVNYGNLPSNIHTLIGNPYASPISPLAVLNGNPGFRDKLWVLDPQIGSVGQYVIYDKVAGYTNISGSYQAGTNIQSGQAFFVRRSSLPENTGATFTITEAQKASNSDNGVFDKSATQSTTSLDKLRVSLWKNNNNQWQNSDAVMAVFYDNGNNAVDMADGGKINGVGENLALMNGASAFTIEHRAVAVPQDVLPVRVSGMLEGTNYQLRVQTEGFNNQNVEVFLHDTFTNTFTAIPTNDTMVTYPFTVTSATASTGNRFQVVFQNSPLGIQNPDGLSQAVVYPNPVNDGMLHIALPTATYQKVSLYNALGQVVYQQNDLGTSNLFQISTQGLANGYYQLQVEDQQGQVYQAKVIIQK